MSRVIKAAELKVLVTDDADTIIPVNLAERQPSSPSETILDGANVLADARQKAEEIIKEAEEQVELLKQEAEEELETLRLKTKEEAYGQGYQEGLVDGEEKALQEAGDLLNVLQNTIDESVRLRASGLAAFEEDFLKLSLLLADKIVRKSIENDVSWLGPIVRDALYALGTVSEVVVYLNPMDYSLLQEHEEGLQVSLRTKIVFQADPALNQGGCLIESENGLIDARLEQRLGKLGRGLLEVLYHESE